MPRYDVITFDCYGTLIDWESGIANAFHNAAAADGVTLTREAVLRAYADTEHHVQAQGYRPYRDILRDPLTVQVGRRSTRRWSRSTRRRCAPTCSRGSRS